MEDQPTVPTPSEPASAVSKPIAKRSNKKALLGVGSVVSVLLIAGATYGILDMTTGTQANQVKPVATVKKVETPQTIDTKVQSDIDREQKLEDQTSNAESQSVTDDINSTQSLEGEYDNF